MAKLAGVSHDIYDKGHKILNSDNEEIKQKVLSGDLSINAGYNISLKFYWQKKSVLAIALSLE